MKKLDIKSEKPRISDSEILATKKSFAHLLKQYHALPKINPLANPTNWFIGGLMVVGVVTTVFILKNQNPEVKVCDAKSQTISVPKADSSNVDTSRRIQESQIIDPIVPSTNKRIESVITDDIISQIILSKIFPTITDSIIKPNFLKVQDTELITPKMTENITDKNSLEMPNCMGSMNFEKPNSGQFRPDWILTEKDGLFGFTTKKGEVIISPKYHKIYPFGFYRQNLALIEKDGLFGFISIDGREVIAPKYNSICNFDDYWQYNALVEKNGLYGLISFSGREIVKPQYHKIYKLNEYLPGWALVEKDGLFGFIVFSGKEMTKPQYHKIYKFGEYLPGFALVEKDGLFGFISIDGREKTPVKYNTIYKFGEFSPGCAVVEKDGLFGLISISGLELIPSKYRTIDEMIKTESRFFKK